MVNEQERLLLRAEMTVGGETHVTHTLEVSPTALKIVSPVGVPVGAGQSVDMLAQEADKVVCITVPHRLFGVGMWYRDFTPVSDEEVLALLAETPRQSTDTAPTGG